MFVSKRKGDARKSITLVGCHARFPFALPIPSPSFLYVPCSCFGAAKSPSILGLTTRKPRHAIIVKFDDDRNYRINTIAGQAWV